MKNIMPVFILGLVSVPFFFNSCQGGFKSQQSLGSNLQSTSCKVTIENGQLQKLRHSYDSVPEIFADSKIQLGPKGDTLVQSSTGKDILTAGTELSAIFDNLCLKELVGIPKTSGIRKLLDDDQEIPLQDLIRQAYGITLKRDYQISELNALAEEDDCLIGMSWDETYLSQSMDLASNPTQFNDAEAYKQEHLASMDTLDGYKAYYGATGPSSTIGQTVRVAVIDSGVDWQHPDLQQNFWTHSQGWGIDATTIQSGIVNYNPFDVSSNGHGTHIAGLIGAVSNNSIGVIGTMPFNAKLMAIKIFKLNAGVMETSTTHFYNGLQFAILNGAEVMNLSLMATGSGYDAVANSAITDALARGITVVGAMGNGSPGALVNGTTLSVIPAIYGTRSGVLAVGSFDSSTKTKSSFSHYSTTYAEISAPGAESTSSGIFSTLPLALGSYGKLKGTSQSTAIVSGAAALVISAIKAAEGVAPSPTEVERLILASAVKNPNLSSYFKDGNQLNLKKLVEKMHLDYPKTKNLGGVVDPTPDPNPCL